MCIFDRRSFMLNVGQLLHLLLIITTLLSLVVGISTFRRSKVPGSNEFSYLMFAISWWAACDTIQFFFDAVPIKMFLAQLSYLGIITAPIAWVSFIFTYSQIQLKIPKWFKYFVFSFCGLFLIIVLTNSYHLMMYKRWSIEAGDFGLSFEYGPFFWAWVLVSYFCLSAGTIRLSRA